MSDRLAGEALIGVVSGSALSGGGPTSFTMGLPAGMGDVLLIDCMAIISGIATVAPLIEEMGAAWAITTPDGTRRSIVGVGRLLQNSVDQVVTSPEKMMLPFLWRAEEFLFLSVPEVDTNASPTAGWNVWARVVRARQMGAQSAGYDPSGR